MYPSRQLVTGETFSRRIDATPPTLRFLQLPHHHVAVFRNEHTASAIDEVLGEELAVPIRITSSHSRIGAFAVAVPLLPILYRDGLKVNRAPAQPDDVFDPKPDLSVGQVG